MYLIDVNWSPTRPHRTGKWVVHPAAFSIWGTKRNEMHLVSFQSTDQEVNQFNTKRGKVKQSLLFGFFINNVKSFLHLLKRLVKGNSHWKKKSKIFCVPACAICHGERLLSLYVSRTQERPRKEPLLPISFLTRVFPNSQLSHFCFFIYVQLVFCLVVLPARMRHGSADLQREKTTNKHYSIKD